MCSTHNCSITGSSWPCHQSVYCCTALCTTKLLSLVSEAQNTGAYIWLQPSTQHERLFFYLRWKQLTPKSCVVRHPSWELSSRFASSRRALSLFVSPLQSAPLQGSPRLNGFHSLDCRSHRVGNKTAVWTQMLRVYSILQVYSEYRVFFVLQVLRVLEYWRPKCS